MERLASERAALAEQAQQLAPAQAQLQLMTALVQAEPPAGRLPRLQLAPGRHANVAAAAELLQGRTQAAEVKLVALPQGSRLLQQLFRTCWQAPCKSCCWLLLV